MNKPIGFENMTPVRRALEVARHELVTLNGLQAFDKVAPQESFEIDTQEATALIDEAIASLDKCRLEESDRRQLLKNTMDFIERAEDEEYGVDGESFLAALDLFKFLVDG